jgi:hypothetical protein
MKKINLPLILCLGALICSFSQACTKSNVKPKNPTPAGTIADGYWFGSFTNTNGLGGGEGILFRANGTLRVYDFYTQGTLSDTTQAAYIGNGTYTVNGTSLTFNFEFNGPLDFSGTGTINTSGSPETVSITYTSPQQSGGSANFTKQ